MPAVLMPRLSDSMESGVILAWLVDEGEAVESGAPLVEIETDKATVVYDAPEAGTLRIEIQAGEPAAVGARLATLDRGDAVLHGTAVASRERIIASPVARRLADRTGVDLGAVNGTGPHGRIVKADVEAAAESPESEPAREQESARERESARELECAREPEPARADQPAVEALSRVQEVIARRMSEAHAAVPDFSLTLEVDMQAVGELRDRIKEDADGESVPSVTDFVVKASALALRQVPRANGSYRDGSWHLHPRVNVGVAVAAPNSLLVPPIFDADRLGLGEIARINRELAARARAGELTPAELNGATFTVSNLGMFGIARFTAIVDSPQAAILAVGAVIDRVVAHEGRPAIRPRMELTLSCDHRILYGADAARFLAAIRDGLERPTRLVL